MSHLLYLVKKHMVRTIVLNLLAIPTLIGNIRSHPQAGENYVKPERELKCTSSSLLPLSTHTPCFTFHPFIYPALS